MTETGYIQTFVARSEGRRLIVRFPGPVENSTDMKSDELAARAVLFIRRNGIDCSLEAINSLLKIIEGGSK